MPQQSFKVLLITGNSKTQCFTFLYFSCCYWRRRKHFAAFMYVNAQGLNSSGTCNQVSASNTTLVCFL